MIKKNSKSLKYLVAVFAMFCSFNFALQAQCTDDCVWPGDMNANGIANNLDVLAYGIAFGEMGPIRAGATTTWEAQEAENWGLDLPVLGADYKHVDANGDGLIDNDDQFVIAVNYNETNENFAGLLGNDLLGDDLFLVPQNTVTSPGGSLFFDVHLGTEDNQISDLYGIGFQLDIDTQYVQGVNFDFSDSWIGVDEEYFGFGKFSDEIDHASTAITRLDGNTISGFGKIAQIEIVIIDVILGFEADSTTCLPFPIEFKNVLAIDNEEGDLMIGSQGETLNLKHPSQLTAVNDLTTIDNSIAIYPNPAQDFLWVMSRDEAIESARIYNQLGQRVLQQSFNNINETQRIDLKSLPVSSGFYFVEIISNNTKSVQKIFINKNP